MHKAWGAWIPGAGAGRLQRQPGGGGAGGGGVSGEKGRHQSLEDTLGEKRVEAQVKPESESTREM